MAYVQWYNPSFGKLGMEISRLWPEKEVIGVKGKRKDTLGLALSGGGYRSAIFCYGVLKGLYEIGVLSKVDYLSAVSGGSWIAMPFAMAEDLHWFFKTDDDSANFMEEGFESLLWNPLRLVEEAALTRGSDNYISDLFGRLLAKTFLREYGDYSRFKPLSEPDFVKDKDRPFLIVNGTVHFRRPERFDITQECFEMTRLYCGSRSIGYIDSASLLADEKPIRVRDAIAVSGAAVSVNVPGLGAEVIGLGLGREIVNYARNQSPSPADLPESDRLDLDDGGHYNNLGVESLVNRGCGYMIVVDAEHDPENKTRSRSNQAYSGLKTLLARNHIPQPEMALATLDRADEAVHVFSGNETVPDILYVKLKSSKDFNKAASKKKYNQPGFLKNLFANGKFSFDPQYSTAKLDYSFVEHRNLSELGAFFVNENAPIFQEFAAKAA
jgi:hypothetical protein